MRREGRRCPREKKQIPPNPLGSVFLHAGLAQVFTWFGSGLKSFVSLEERAGCHHRQPRREPGSHPHSKQPRQAAPWRHQSATAVSSFVGGFVLFCSSKRWITLSLGSCRWQGVEFGFLPLWKFPVTSRLYKELKMSHSGRLLRTRKPRSFSFFCLTAAVCCLHTGVKRLSENWPTVSFFSQKRLHLL